MKNKQSKDALQCVSTNAQKSGSSRRNFLVNAALGTAGVIGVASVLSGCKEKKAVTYPFPPMLEKAPDGKALKAGVIGCGGRGTGAAMNFLNAGNDLTIVACADIFQDRIDNFRKELKEKKNMELADDKCFIGLDAYKKVLETDCDIVILATSPYFRPEHFRAAVEAKKHIFTEKPVAVDPVGARAFMAAAKKAQTLGLTVVTGTQRRHQADYIETFRKVAEGAIGDIVGGNVYWNQSKLWHVNPNPEWNEMENMIRNWVNWTWLSGDHIVEQHIHNLDVANWFLGKFPVSAVGFGSRQRRLTADQYDNFSVDFVYEGNIHIHSMCRQINDCANNVSEYLRGTKGYTNCQNTIWNPDGTVLWQYEYPKNEAGEPSGSVKVNPYDQEHIDLVTSIRTSTPFNEAETTAMTNIGAIMGRMSAYTGKEVTMDEVMKSDLVIGPKEVTMDVKNFPIIIPVPGSAPAEG
jgi:predicted dehydrogenase